MQKKNMFFLLLVSMILSSYLSMGQQQCFTTLDEGELEADPPTYFTTPCKPTSAIFNDFFKYKENYVPPNGSVTALTTIKAINVVIHVLNPSILPTPKQNFIHTAADSITIRQMIDTANKYLANVPAPSDPYTAYCGACHVYDSRLRIHVVDIVFDTDENNFDDVFVHGSDITSYHRYTNTALNIYLMPNIDYTVIGGVTNLSPGTGFGSGDYELINGILNLGPAWIMLKGFEYNRSTMIKLSTTLLHEIGHALGLFHTYKYSWGKSSGSGDTPDETRLDYLTDLFKSGAAKKYPRPYESAHCTNPFSNSDDSCTNNIMGGAYDVYHFTPQQLGRIHRNAHFASCRMYMSPFMPEDADHDHTGEGQLHPYIVNSDQTWDFDIKMYGDIEIPAGKTLTIKCQVRMPYLSNIIVKQGGKLIVDGGKITSDQDSTVWYGISVWGNAAKAQDDPLYPQGKIEIKNGAVIQNALHAVVMGDEVYGTPNFGGGIATISDAYFLNNRNSVTFWDYHNRKFPFFRVYPNLSYIQNTSFKIDDNLLRTPQGQVHIWNVEGIQIQGCTFENAMTSTKWVTMGGGNAIHTSGANFNLTDLARGATYYPSTITGFTNGVYVTCFDLQNQFSVSYTSFNRNENGIAVSNTDMGKIHHNTFDKIEHPINPAGGAANGIKIYASNFYKVYSNQFTATSYTNAGNTLGVFIDNCGSINNVINNNVYNQLRKANYSRGMNTNGEHVDPTISSGLQFLCNTYQNVGYGEYVESNNVAHGIRYGQGALHKPAGNTFLSISGMVNLYRTNTHDFLYYYGAGMGEYPTSGTFMGITRIPTGTVADCSLPLGFDISNGYTSSGLPWVYAGLQTAYDDSTDNRMTYIRNALYTISNPYADVERSIQIMQMGQAVSGLATYDSIFTRFTLNPTELNEFTLGRTVIRMLSYHHLNQISMDSLTSTEKDSLHYVIANSNMWPRAKACNWLQFATGEICSEIPLGNRDEQTEKTTVINTTQPALSINPNPFSDQFSIDYFLDSDADLIIYDISGRTISKYKLKAKEHTYKINAERWNNGMHFYKVLVNGKSIINGKLLKS
jgi:hypothetical protein